MGCSRTSHHVHYCRSHKSAIGIFINRYYDPATGQFVSVDPLAALTKEPYAYTAGNPINFSDPTGLCAGKQSHCSWYNMVCQAKKHWRGIVEGAAIVGLVAVNVTTDEFGVGEAADAALLGGETAGEGAVDAGVAATGDAGTQAAGATGGDLTGITESDGVTTYDWSDGTETAVNPNDASSIQNEITALNPGNNPGVYTVQDAQQLQNLFDQLSSGGTPITGTTYPGDLVELPDGTTVGIRQTSRTGGPTIDVKLPNGSQLKVHIGP